MDKKLLLAIQFACNTTGVTVPWDKVGAIMGPQISSGAVIQHLAKVRGRLIELGLPVPPPLRRGGGSARTAIAATAPKKAGVTKGVASKKKSTRKRAEHKTDDSGDEDDDWKDEDSDLDFGQPRAKRTKLNAKGPSERTIKKENSDDSNEEFVAAGAGFLALEDDHGSRPKTSKKTPSKNKKTLIVSLPSTMGNIKEEDDDISDNESEAETTGGGLARGRSHQDYSTSPYDQNLADLAAAQMEPASGLNNPSSYVGTYHNLHHTSPQVNAFDGGLYRNNQSLFQQPSGDIDFDFLNSGEEVNIDFNSDEYMNGVGIIGIGTNGNGTYNGSAQQSALGYQPGNGFYTSPNVFGNDHHGHLPLSHWSNEVGFAGSSMATTANQTPAENSAGADFGGYFHAQFQADAFDGEGYFPSASNGMDSLNSDFVPDTFNNEFYGNGSSFD